MMRVQKEIKVQLGRCANGSSINAAGPPNMPGSDDGGGGTVVVTRLWTAQELSLGEHVVGPLPCNCCMRAVQLLPVG